MIKAKINRPKLERSLKRFAKDFGDTNAQAICRWGVQTCRELAGSTQAFGRTTKARRAQEGAIIADAYEVLLVVDNLRSTGKGYRATNHGKSYSVGRDKVCSSPEEVNHWIELNRTRRRARTAHLSNQDKKVCDRATFKAAMRPRFKAAGMAKGGWIGAGQDIARAQKGTGRINIGKNFLGYAQKHSRMGDATHPNSGWSPSAKLHNKTAHSASRHVLSRSEENKAVDWGLKKTLSWYRAAMRRQNQKQRA